jgi:hypothetical protein
MLELHLSEKTSAQTMMFGLQEQQLKSLTPRPIEPDGRNEARLVRSIERAKPHSRKKPGSKAGLKFGG